MRNYIISLAEPVNLLKETFREQLVFNIQTKNRNVQLMGESLNYNCVPYMDQLLNEIFQMGQDPNVSEVSESTKKLVREGLDEKVARPLAHQLFQLTVDALGTMVPDLSFGNLEGYGVGMCGEYDVMITPPFGYAKDEEEVEEF